MPEVLIEEVNPYRTRRASLLVEAGNLYLYVVTMPAAGVDATLAADAAPQPTVAAVWVANLGAAPDRLEPGLQDGGRPPIMGRDGTAFPLGCPPPGDRLELVWFEEGDGVALLDQDGLLAVIPGWGGKDGFNGYSRYSRAQTPLAWPLGPEAEATLDARVIASRNFWRWRLTDGWKEIEATGVEHLEARVGPQETLWRVDGGGFPEMAASRHRLGDHEVWITSTTGLSGQRMPQVDQFPSRPAGRVELAVASRTSDDELRDAIVGPASIPFGRMTWLGDGHIVEGQAETNASLGADVAAVLLSATPPADAGVARPDLSGLVRRDEPVTWLWVLALDAPTLSLAKTKGPNAALDALASAGRSWVQEHSTH